MSQAAESLAPGRRERKKQETRAAIKRAALTLALERGVERLTVEGIADAADVSPRTFFNYFASKEEALIGDGEEVSTELAALIAARPDGEPPLRSLHAAITESRLLKGPHSQREQLRVRERLIRDNPSLLRRQLEQYSRIESTFIDAVAARLGVDPDTDLRPALLAAMAVSVLRVAMRRWTVDDARPPDDLVDEAFALLEAGP